MSKHKNELVITGHIKKAPNPWSEPDSLTPSYYSFPNPEGKETIHKVTFHIEVTPLQPSTVKGLACCHIVFQSKEDARDTIKELKEGRFVHVFGQLNIWPHSCHTAYRPSHFDIHVETIDFPPEETPCETT